MRTQETMGRQLLRVIYVTALLLCMSGAAFAVGNTFDVLATINEDSSATQVIAVNEAINKIYLSGGASGGQTVYVVDGTTFSSNLVGTGSGANVDIKSDRYWAGDVFGGGVIVRDSSNNTVTTVPLAGCPVETTYDFKFNRMWSGAQCGNGNDPVFAIDANRFTIVHGPIDTGGVMGPAIANGASGRLYLLSNNVSKRVHPLTFAVTTNAFGTVMAINTLTNRLYASSGNNLQIINGGPDPEVILTTVSLPYAPSAIGVNTELNHLYLSNQAGNMIEVRNSSTGALLASWSLGAGNTPGFISIDSLRGRVYVNVSTPSGPQLWVLEDLINARKSSSNLG